MTPAEMAAEGRRLSGLLDIALQSNRDRVQATAEAEREYRKAKALAYVTITEGTAAAREAEVNGACADLRYHRDLAEGLRQAALEAVRSRRTQVSACQSLLNAHQEEAKFARTGVER